jgi:hypothetical protein
MAEEEAKKEEFQSEDEKESELTKFKSEHQLARGLVQQIGQALIQWLPVGSSGFILATFLLQQNWLMVVVTLPITAIAVFWASFTETLLSKIKEMGKKMGEESGTFLEKWLRAILEGISWQFAGTEENYLRCQGKQHEVIHSRTEGLSSFKPLLSDVVIPLELNGDFARSPEGHHLPMPFRGSEKDLEKVNHLRIWDILRRSTQDAIYRNIVISQYGGYGKTTLLRHVTYIYCQKQHQKPPYKAPKLLPVLISFRQWQTILVNEKPDLSTFIETFHIQDLPGGKDLKLPKNWAKYWLNQKPGMLVMFDGFDEVKQENRTYISQWLGQQMRHYPQAIFILTTRPTAYNLHFDAESKPNCPFKIIPLDADQKELLIKRWYLSWEKYISASTKPEIITAAADKNSQDLLQQIAKSPELKDLAKNPLLLVIMLNLHVSRPGADLPDRRVDLYREIIRLQLGDRPLAKKIKLLLPTTQDSERVLQKLALGMVQAKVYTIDKNSLLSQLQTILNGLTLDPKPEDLLTQLEEVSELLVKVDQDYEFVHRYFQDYLAAQEIIETKQQDLLLTHWQETEWEETILMYASLANDVPQFISALLAFNQQFANDLAYKCLQRLKTANRRISPSLEQSITVLQKAVENPLFQQLETYLKNGQWREADEETTRLMLLIAKREDEGYLDVESIEKFPCEELRTLDKLWVENSGGKFGFSVQKKVWIACGGIPGEYDWEVYKKFADQVGWRRGADNRWLSYDELTFLFKVGWHLPSRHLFTNQRAATFLAQRLLTCNISQI